MPIKSALHLEASKRIEVAEIDFLYEKDTPFYTFFYALLERHPNKSEKIKDGILGFLVGFNGFKSRTTFLISNNNQRIDFSWVKCCRGRDLSPKTKLRAAFREAIQCQVIMYGEKDHDVHHVIPFESLARDFESKYPALDYSVTDNKSGTFGSMFKSQETKQLWEAYHLTHAILETVSKKEHKEMHGTGNKHT